MGRHLLKTDCRLGCDAMKTGRNFSKVSGESLSFSGWEIEQVTLFILVRRIFFFFLMRSGSSSGKAHIGKS
jgi:hypothetical protein